MRNHISYAQVHEWPFGVSSKTYMTQTAKQKRGHLKFHHPLLKHFFENFIWYIKWCSIYIYIYINSIFLRFDLLSSTKNFLEVGR